MGWDDGMSDSGGVDAVSASPGFWDGRSLGQEPAVSAGEGRVRVRGRGPKTGMRMTGGEFGRFCLKDTSAYDDGRERVGC